MQLPPGVSAKLGEAVAWQAALDRAGFSPGIIDGLVGPKTDAGLRAFQENAGLEVTGEFDAATRAAIGLDSTSATRVYVLTQADKAAVGPCPRNWVAKSKLRRLGFASLEQVAANRGHCRRDLLAKLNSGLDLTSLEPGSKLVIPNVRPRKQNVRAAAIEIDFGTKIIRAFDRRGGLVGLFHCSIAKEKRQRPSGRCKVKNVTPDPTYTFKPESWPEVKGVHRWLIIPPGPRNPVGLCWIGLTKKGYGIHGTPQPELIELGHPSPGRDRQGRRGRSVRRQHGDAGARGLTRLTGQGNRILIRRPEPPALPGVGAANGRAVDLPRQSRGLGERSQAPEGMARAPMKTRMRLACLTGGCRDETGAEGGPARYNPRRKPAFRA